MKKITSLLLAIFMGTSMLAMASCGGNKGNNNNNDSSVECTEHVYSEDFVCVKEPTCTEVGKKAIACVNCGEIKGEQADIIARGHDYGNAGVCKRCSKKAVVPAADPSATYIDPTDSSSGINGTGKDFDRYGLSVDGYYQIELGRTGQMWVEFAFPEAGQYALYSTQNNGVKVTRYDASAQYIPIDENGNYIGFEGGKLDGNNFISTVNCGTIYWNDSIRATFCFAGSNGSSAKIHIVKIDEPAWQPSYEHVDIRAEQIDGNAPEGPEGSMPVVVPYTTDYFLDDTGYYRMGTPENPGNLIYVAITATAERMFLDSSFSAIQYQGPNLFLDGGYNADGNHIVLNYAPFIMNDTNYGGTFDSYQTYVNSDGMYPVNEELFTFLNLYIQKNMPMDIPAEIWEDPVAREHSAWLAACFYYAELELGSSLNPYKITDSTFTVTTIEYDYVYYSLRYTNQTNSNIYVSFVDVICEDENALMQIGDKNYYGPFNVRVETNANKGAEIKFASKDGSVISYDVVLQDAQDGAADHPLTLTLDENGNATLEFTAIHMLDGSISYETYYEYVATKTGTLTFSTEADIYMLASNVTVDSTASSTDGTESTSTDVYLNNGVANMNVKAGDVISIYVSSKTADSVSFNIQ